MNARTGAMASAYTSASLNTASPQKLIVLLYERLVLDLTRAEDDIRSGRSPHEQLVHAQEIVMELLGSLKPELWSGAAGLGNLYTYLHTQLVTANVRRDADLVATCRDLVEPLLDAWRQAYESTLATAAGEAAARAAASATSTLTDLSARETSRVPLSVTA
ncbi:MAG: flagellar export chaperone FliS [Candidatus Nanopelagicales bacterium]